MEELLERYPKLSVCREDIEKASRLIYDTYKNGGKVLVCGNGGSAADSEHIVGELMKGFLKKREVSDERIPESLRKMMYAQLVYGYAKENDLVIGISTSGNSKNVVNAVKVAKCMGVKTLSLTGEKESKLSGLSDVTVKVPETETFKVQELHLPVYHYLCAYVENMLF